MEIIRICQHRYTIRWYFDLNTSTNLKEMILYSLNYMVLQVFLFWKINYYVSSIELYANFRYLTSIRPSLSPASLASVPNLTYSSSKSPMSPVETGSLLAWPCVSAPCFHFHLRFQFGRVSTSHGHEQHPKRIKNTLILRFPSLAGGSQTPRPLRITATVSRPLKFDQMEWRLSEFGGVKDSQF
ncbi:hypothetical protein IW261DRAFT_545657 [Armillaria novae-zelandiae]|uniref:Uncharacterized protein n=1 Tax=Armillaria novae-zelandiae TaxID=153914 RepID=A0AA39NZ44_9AGAR|nr:hypothetical protein IW261DRAFT_545657 [Armillaria novae-zelandiae]